jgi:hypothetical protein
VLSRVCRDDGEPAPSFPIIPSIEAFEAALNSFDINEHLASSRMPLELRRILSDDRRALLVDPFATLPSWLPIWAKKIREEKRDCSQSL